METYDRIEAAERIGVGSDRLDELIDQGILGQGDLSRLTSGQVRRARLAVSLLAAGVPIDGLGQAIRSGQVSLDFLDAPAFERFSANAGVTFAELADQYGVPVETLVLVREASGSASPGEGDRVRDDELAYARLIAAQLEIGIRLPAIQQLIRAHGDTLRRLAETESAMWQSEVIEPAARAGRPRDEVLGTDFGDRIAVLSEEAVVAMYHLQQARAWTAGIIDTFEGALADAGVHSRLEHPPAMCFLDVTGYTQLTQEHGDAAAAKVAEALGRVVDRTSIAYGGRAVKWLGDGVMLHFPNPGLGVVAALEMVSAAVEAGLPPVHVGMHAGPVIFQEGDYYGQTVNLASRIADYARPGQVIVSGDVVEAANGVAVTFQEVGPVELKGVAGAMQLYAAHRPG
jgi:adenylate cyclase